MKGGSGKEYGRREEKRREGYANERNKKEEAASGNLQVRLQLPLMSQVWRGQVSDYHYYYYFSFFLLYFSSLLSASLCTLFTVFKNFKYFFFPYYIYKKKVNITFCSFFIDFHIHLLPCIRFDIIVIRKLSPDSCSACPRTPWYQFS